MNFTTAMHLAVDAGNTHIGIGVHDGTGWIARWRLKTDAHRTADEYRVVLADLFGSENLVPQAVHRITLSSVVPELTPVFDAVSSSLFVDAHVLHVRPGVKTGMDVRYEPPKALGPDRLADAVAARENHGAPVIAVDFGTATTFSVVGIDGAFVGGAIAPGLSVATSALAASGARLARIDLDPKSRTPLIGRTTEESMRSGILHGYAGLVDGLLERMHAELGRRAPVVATGGLAALISSLVERIDVVNPDLTLDGLRLIGERNA